MAVTTLALAGDTMLGRGVAEFLRDNPAGALFGSDLLEVVADADGMVLNLECAISDRGSPRPGRVFHFRAPPVAVDALTLLGVRGVTIANNHALDFGDDALLDTVHHLTDAGIAVAGAGADISAARTPTSVRIGAAELSLVAFTDHPAEFAAVADRPGVNYVDISGGVPTWLSDSVRGLSASGGPVLVLPHWGPNMAVRPRRYVRRAATELVAAGASLLAGHSAHLFHGVAGSVLFDLGDFIDDYAINAELRNDLGLLWLVTFEGGEPRCLEAVPLRLEYCHTALAAGEDAAWIRRRFRRACRELGTDVAERGERLVVDVSVARDLLPLPPPEGRRSVPLGPSDEGEWP